MVVQLATRALLAIIEEVSLTWILGLAFVSGFALAWAIGANDVANAFGTSVGAKVLTLRQAIVLAGIFEFLGAFLMGSQVADTLRDGILIPEQYENDPAELAVGMTAAMIGAWFLVTLATWFNLPVSATHSIIGAVMGFALFAQGIDGVLWWEVGKIIISWITSPLCAGTLAFVMFVLIRKFILRSSRSFEKGLYFMPFCYFGTLTINVFFVTFKGSGGGFIDLSVIPLYGVFIISMGSGYAIGALVYFLLPFIRRRAEKRTETIQFSSANIAANEKRAYTDHSGGSDDKSDHSSVTNSLDSIQQIKPEFVPEEFEAKTEELFSFLQIMTACFGSFAHGANDVANAIGPFATVLSVYQTCTVDQDAPIPTWVLVGGGFGIVVGLATWGYRVMATIGEKLCKVTPSRGFNIELAAAITVVTGSSLGLPLSTTHCKVGGVVGVGMADGKAAVNWKLVITVFAGWIVTLPIAAAVAGVLYLILWNAFTYYGPNC